MHQHAEHTAYLCFGVREGSGLCDPAFDEIRKKRERVADDSFVDFFDVKLHAPHDHRHRQS